jgi:hypothetical protein
MAVAADRIETPLPGFALFSSDVTAVAEKCLMRHCLATRLGFQKICHSILPDAAILAKTYATHIPSVLQHIIHKHPTIRGYINVSVYEHLVESK